MPAMRKYKIQVFCDIRGDWRYRLRAPNGQVMQSGEAYASSSNAKRAAGRFARLFEVTPVVEVI